MWNRVQSTWNKPYIGRNGPVRVNQHSPRTHICETVCTWLAGTCTTVLRSLNPVDWAVYSVLPVYTAPYICIYQHLCMQNGAQPTVKGVIRARQCINQYIQCREQCKQGRMGETVCRTVYTAHRTVYTVHSSVHSGIHSIDWRARENQCIAQCACMRHKTGSFMWNGG